ncbi:MAG: RNA polymerase sigma-70 factor [Cytophagales bacterium]|nr:RNA polymerase sigma-70 factor [Cytophagales bacterium]
MEIDRDANDLPHLKEDNALLFRLTENDKSAFDCLFTKYYSSLVVFSQKIIREQEAAEDLVQDFFYNLWIRRNDYTIKQSFRSYAFSSIRNRSIDYLRHIDVENKAAEYFLSDPDYLKEDTLHTELELKEMLEKALDKLPEKCRKIFLLNRFEGLMAKEIAKKESLSVRTVEKHIGKAVKIMREELKPFVFLFFFLR